MGYHESGTPFFIIIIMDLRIYTYSAGGLYKVGKGLHKQKTIRTAMQALKHLKAVSNGQLVIVEYTDKYKSDIIYVSPMDLAKTI
jgi:hypothetical protein